MGKKLTLTGANAVRTILKNKDDFHADLRDETKDGARTTYVFDFEYDDHVGTFTIATEDGDIKVAVLNLSMGRIISLVNDANIKKLAQYVLDTSL